MLIPFDLEKALSGAKVVTRDGRLITDWHYFKNTNETYPIYFVHKDTIETCMIDGTFNHNSKSSLDLLLEIECKSFYMNVYEGEAGGIFGGHIYSTKESCEKQKSSEVGGHSKHLKTVEINLEQP